MKPMSAAWYDQLRDGSAWSSNFGPERGRS
jgi:hypothetical protein